MDIELDIDTDIKEFIVLNKDIDLDLLNLVFCENLVASESCGKFAKIILKYHNEIKGLNSRLDPIQAAVLKVKLKYLASWNERRQYISELYFKYLSNKHFQLNVIGILGF